MNPLTDLSQILIGELENFHSLVLELSALTFKVKIHTVPKQVLFIVVRFKDEK